MKEILDVVHKTIYQFFDVCGDNEEVPMSDKNKVLLEVNKAICDNLKALEQESILDKIREEIEQLRPNLRPEQMTDYDYAMVDAVNDIVAIFDKYMSESEVQDGNDN